MLLSETQLKIAIVSEINVVYIPIYREKKPTSGVPLADRIIVHFNHIAVKIKSEIHQ